MSQANISIELKVLSRLLCYPDATLRSDLPDMRRALQHTQALTAARRSELDTLMLGLQQAHALDIESAYVDLFDSGRSTSLHLFEHVHGDSRERGPAMVDLARTYAQVGLALHEGELPDYLPAVLEFASTRAPQEARAFLGEIAAIAQSIFSALLARNSAYASVLGALLELSGETAQAVAVSADESLDTTWEEPLAFGGCSTRGQARAGQAQPLHFVKSASTGAAHRPGA